MNLARLISDQQYGSMNMAVDEALLLSSPRSGPTLRFYQWKEPTLSLGYFQSAAERRQHAASVGTPMVRRSTGGGAILHQHELTYSFVLPLNKHDNAASQSLYYAFHETLIQALAAVDIVAQLYGDEPSPRTSQEEPFLCFQRRSAGDVLVGSFKVCGSAQRRQREALLQHGSVLIQRSEFAPELPGIADLTGVGLPVEKLTEVWLPLLERKLELRFKPGEMSSQEQADAKRLSEDRFGADPWSLRR